MTTLSDRLVEYLDHRRRFGYRRIRTTAAVLRRFAAFADDFGAESITTELFLEWRKQFEAPSDVTWGCNLSHVRGFAKWLHCLDPRTEVPSADLIRRGNRRPRPYIYTEEELASIVDACGATALTTRAERVDLLDPLRTDCGHGTPARGGTGAR